ncbi:MAG: ACP phosphodiesterase [Pseudomonadota bacterium]
MNHLAHALLADDTPGSIIGNLSGDFVRGPVDSRFAPQVADGIRMHRKVDTFTDSNAIIRSGKKRFIGAHRRVAGIVLDVFYDHCLYLNWESFSDEQFDAFCRRIYTTLNIHRPLAPEYFHDYIPRFIERDMLASCCTLEGVEAVIERLATRWSNKPDMQRLLIAAGHDARNQQAEIEADFLRFFPQLLEATSANAETF